VDSLEAGGARRSQPPDFEAVAAIEAEAFGALAEGSATPRVRTLGVCHRLAVFENDEANDAMRIVAVASQLDVVRFLHRRVDALGAAAEATIDELALASFGESSGGVVTAPWDASALECFATMRARGVSAVGVVDQAGELVANLSASDLRRLDARSFRLLALPVAEFISRRKGDAIGRRGAPFAEARKLERAREVDERRAETLKAGMAAEKSGEEAPKSAGDERRGDGNGGSAEVPISSSDEDSDRATVSAAARERRDERALQKGEAKRAEGVDEGGYSSGSSSGGADLRRPPLPKSSRTFVELVFARGDTTLRRVLHLMTAHAIHHVYVVDDEDKPRAVVTPTDILRLFVVDDEESPWRERWEGGPHAEDAEDARGEGRGTEKTPPTYGGAEGVVV
jgi:CBS domain-containing protein